MAEQYLTQRPQSFSAAGAPVMPEGPKLSGEAEAAAWDRGAWYGGIGAKISRSLYGKDPSFNPYTGLEGHEPYIAELLDDTSQAERDDHLRWIQTLEDDARAAHNGTFGLTEALFFGVSDPINLIPIPVLKGIGYAKGLAYGTAANMALTAGTEVVRHQFNPLATTEESVNNVLLSGLVGAGIGAAAGGLRLGFRGLGGSILRRYDLGLGWVDEDLTPVNLNGFDDDMHFEWQRPPQRPDGTRPVMSIDDEPFGFGLEAVDNVNYGWHMREQRWVDARELAADTPGPVDPAVLGRLPPRPAPKVRKVWSANDVKLGEEWQQGTWRQRLDQYLPANLAGRIDDLIPQPKNYMLYRRMEFLWERRLPQQPGETVADWKLRVGTAAMREYMDAKKPKGFGGFIGKFSEYSNFAPGVKAVRKSGGDSIVGDLVYRLIGDNGVQLQSGAPPSVMMKILNDRRHYRAVQAGLDAEYYKYASGQVTNSGMQALNANVGAQMMGNRFFRKGMAQPGSMDRETFNAMAAEAVFNPNAFTLNGHAVNAHVREAAKHITKALQVMEVEARDTGVFASQRSLERDIKRYDRQMIRIKDSINRWLWGQTGSPTAYDAAVWVQTPNHGDFTFTGTTHEEAMNRMFNELADQAIPVSENLGPQNFGYQIAMGQSGVPIGQSWITLDNMMAQRVSQLTPAQRAVFDAKKSALDIAEANHLAAVDQLANFNASPHVFKDIHGNIENYFPRHWSQELAASKREDMEILFTAYYSLTNPIGALQRAQDTIDGIIDGSVQPHGIGTMSNLRARELSMPNSFETTHPVTGRVIKVTDFIDMNAATVMESYTRRLMTNINLTRMFGDANLSETFADLRAHLVDKYVQPTMTQRQVDAAMEQVREIEGLVDISLRQLKGTLKTRSPAEMSNQVASILGDTTSMMLLPKVVYNTTTDAGHIVMANGLGTFLRAAFGKLADDFANGAKQQLIGLSKEIDDVHDFSKTVFNARVQMENLGMPETGRWRITDFIRDRVGGFYKLNGLTAATAWLKEVAAICAQHNILRDILDAAPALKNGTQPNEVLLDRLKSYGFNERMVVQISEMPLETWKGAGNLLMPNITAWTGHEGKVARAAMLNAMTGETRRAVVTPGLADTSSIFQGVLTHRGKVVYENDLMKLPMQLLPFSMAAQNKILTSFLQGRDRSNVVGMAVMMGLTYVSLAARADPEQWKRRQWNDIMLETARKSGLGGFWLGDLPQMIDRATGGQVDAAILGREPRKRTQGERFADMAGVFGPAASTYADLSRVFWDPEMNAEQRAMAVRKMLIYPQILWWDGITRKMTSDAVGTGKELFQ